MYIREDGTEITILMLQNDTFFLDISCGNIKHDTCSDIIYCPDFVPVKRGNLLKRWLKEI